MPLWVNVIPVFIFLCVTNVHAKDTDSPVVYTGPKGTWINGLFMCFVNVPLTESFPPQSTVFSYESIFILHCEPNNYADELKALNINTTVLKSLTHYFYRNETLFHGNYTEGLTITNLTLRNSAYDNQISVYENNKNFLEPLTKLTTLTLINVQIPVLPETVQLLNLTLVDDGLIETWGNCKYLQYMMIKYTDDQYERIVQENVIVPLWPKYCTRLQHLAFQDVPPEKLSAIADQLVNAATSIIRLDVRRSGLDIMITQLMRSAKNLTYLNLEDNNIHGDESFMNTFLRFHSNLPATIKWLNLRNNRISRASGQEAAALFAATRRVWLAGNPLLCDCDNRALIDAIQQHREQVVDYNLLRCVGTDGTISSVSTTALCETALLVSLVTSLILLFIIAILIFLLRRYGYQIRMYLYSKGWCVSCLRKLEVNEKPYDAFLSFAHEDHEYVESTLLPGLENCPERFRVCVHYRDWQVGDWIPNQIMRSVQQSRRTLILLSRNFVTSPWSNLEFKYAQAIAAEELNTKVLVLVLDDVLDMTLSLELRRYVTYNTYLRCDDQWFWEKLRYAMPHRPSEQATNLDDNNDEIGDPDVIVTHQLEPENIPN